MAHKLKVNKRFEKDVTAVYEYILEKWGFPAADNFVKKVDKRIKILQEHPFFGNPSFRNVEIRKTQVTKHNKLYYRVKGNRIALLRLIDTRKDPEKN